MVRSRLFAIPNHPRSPSSRIWAGIHYRSDIAAGAAIGKAVADKVIARARTDGAQ